MRCVLGAAELAARLQFVIQPALAAGTTVIVNKYVASAQAHGLIRGLRREFLQLIYDFAIAPDIIVLVDVEPAVALARKQAHGKLGFWESGVDRALESSLEESLRRYVHGELDEEFVAQSFLNFQALLRHALGSLLRDSPVWVLDGSEPRAVVRERAHQIIHDAVIRAGRV
jgi:thymidylate kinase